MPGQPANARQEHGLARVTEGAHRAGRGRGEKRFNTVITEDFAHIGRQLGRRSRDSGTGIWVNPPRRIKTRRVRLFLKGRRLCSAQTTRVRDRHRPGHQGRCALQGDRPSGLRHHERKDRRVDHNCGEPGRQARCLPVGQQGGGARRRQEQCRRGGHCVWRTCRRRPPRGAGTAGSGRASTRRRTVLRLTQTSKRGAQTGAGPARQGETDRGQRRAQPLVDVEEVLVGFQPHLRRHPADQGGQPGKGGQPRQPVGPSVSRGSVPGERPCGALALSTRLDSSCAAPRTALCGSVDSNSGSRSGVLEAAAEDESRSLEAQGQFRPAGEGPSLSMASRISSLSAS